MAVPINWIRYSLALIAAVGVLVGALSLVFPKRSIELYQWIMKNFNWRVEPIDYERELRNTRALGFWLLVTSMFLLTALLKPELVLVQLGELRE